MGTRRARYVHLSPPVPFIASPYLFSCRSLSVAPTRRVQLTQRGKDRIRTSAYALASLARRAPCSTCLHLTAPAHRARRGHASRAVAGEDSERSELTTATFAGNMTRTCKACTVNARKSSRCADCTSLLAFSVCDCDGRVTKVRPFPFPRRLHPLLCLFITARAAQRCTHTSLHLRSVARAGNEDRAHAWRVRKTSFSRTTYQAGTTRQLS